MKYLGKEVPSIINLWAGPGTGKSRTAAALFNLMKYRGHRVELVTERAKFYTYEGNITALKDQFLLMAQQEYSQRIVASHVDYIITDSPPMMGIAYADSKDSRILVSMAMHFRSRYDNYDILLKRDDERAYETYGRNENEVEARAKDIAVQMLFDQARKDHSSFDHMECIADPAAANAIYDRMVMNA